MLLKSSMLYLFYNIELQAKKNDSKELEKNKKLIKILISAH